MKKLISVITALTIMMPITSIHAQMTQEKQDVIITMKDGVVVPSDISRLGEGVRMLKSVPILMGEFSKKDIEELKKNPNILQIEQDVKVKKVGANVVDKNKISTTATQNIVEKDEWDMKKIKAPESWANGYTGKGVKVAVIDTGIDKEHEDLTTVGGASFVDYTTSYDDDEGHGTHVAGTIAAKHNGKGIKGVAPDVSLYGVKVLDDWGSGNMSDVISGIDWAITNEMDVINMSLGAEETSPALDLVIQRAIDSNVVVVSAAGNEGNSAGTGDNMLYPGKLPDVISVGATDLNNKRAVFSSTGPNLVVSAPGDNILSTYLDNQYDYLDGTSMATPHVAGIMALYKESHPTLTNKQLKDEMITNVVDLGSEVGKDPLYGYGLIQAPTKYEKAFPDVPHNHWAYDAIGTIVDKKWMNGYVDGKFGPNNPLTRAQAAVVMVKSLDLKPLTSISQSFSDVNPTHWAFNEIEIAKQHGVFGGTGDGKFAPSKTLTRVQASSIIAKGLKFPLENPSTPSFVDVKQTYWAYQVIETIKAKNIISGYGDSTFKPGVQITRAQFASILSKMSHHMD